MLTQDVINCLVSANLSIYIVQPSEYKSDRIVLNCGRLVYRDKNFDKLFITHSKGLPHAILIITYFFAEDTVCFFPGFIKPYQSITINNIKYTKLSPELLDQFALFKFATLEHNEEATQD